MRNHKKFIILIFIFSLAPCLCSCWNYKELDKVAIISGIAIDKDKDKYLIAVEIVSQGRSSKAIGSQTSLSESEGYTLLDAIRNLIPKMGKRAYWGHCKVIIINESIAEESIIPVLDLFERDAEARSNIHLIISSENTAKEIFTSGQSTNKNISFLLDNMINNTRDIGKYPKLSLFEFIASLEKPGVSEVVPMVKINTSENTKEPYIDNCAVFKKDKLKGHMSLDQCKNLLFIKNEISKGAHSILNVSPSGTDISLEIFDSKTKITPDLEGKVAMIYIDVKFKASIAEVMGNYDITNPNNLYYLKKYSEGAFANQLENFIKASIERYDSDIFNFASIIIQKSPKGKKFYEENRSNYLQKLNFKVNVDFDLKWSALTSEPIKVGD